MAGPGLSGAPPFGKYARAGEHGGGGMISAGRYEVVQDPIGAWCVWDVRTGHPAHMSGSTLFGLCRREAEAFCCLLSLAPDMPPPVDGIVRRIAVGARLPQTGRMSGPGQSPSDERLPRGRQL
jgi:hypothetical protein